jgi:hypothetical protein
MGVAGNFFSASNLAGVVAPDEEGVISEGEEFVVLGGMGRVGGPCLMVNLSCCSTLSAALMGVAHFLSLRPLLPLGGVGVDWVLATDPVDLSSDIT